MTGIENVVLCTIIVVIVLGIARRAYKLGFKHGREKTIFEVRKDFVLMNNRLEDMRMKVYHLERPETEKPTGNKPYLKPEKVDQIIDSMKDDKPAGWGNV